MWAQGAASLGCEGIGDGWRAHGRMISAVLRAVADMVCRAQPLEPRQDEWLPCHVRQHSRGQPGGSSSYRSSISCLWQSRTQTLTSL